ncbi:MAG: DNA repair protein RadA [Pseudomonadota bacterium]
MAKAKTAYLCTDCGAHSVKWQGQCPDCGAWNSLTETRPQTGVRQTVSGAEPAALGELAAVATSRYPTGFEEFDRVLGGGLVPGSVVLLGGDPGVGKSTLLQQVAARLPEDLSVLYATGEESLQQVAQRSQRIGTENAGLQLLADTALENILTQAAATTAKVIVVDSIQTVVSDSVSSAPGSVAQLRECVGQLVRYAKDRDVALFLIGHVTKEGAIAGPRVVEHMVDTVLYFENDASSRYTIVRAVKNRFGASSELGVLAMTESGFLEVRNPSAIFLSGRQGPRPGSLTSVTWEGSRPLLVEIQALVAEGVSNYPKRLANGIDQSRLALLVAVLQRHGGIALGNDDVFVNVTGGLRINETAADLPVLLSIVSSFRDRAFADGVLSFGEVGLSGEVRPVRFGTERLSEAAKQGYKRAIVPANNVPRRAPDGLEVVPVEDLATALDVASDR